jgi:hypothetical protein
MLPEILNIFIMPIFGRMIKHCNAIKKALIIIVMWIDEGLHGLERDEEGLQTAFPSAKCTAYDEL